MTTPYPVPAAHEEPLASVTRVLALGEGARPDSFTATSLPQLSGRIYGGQVVAQALLAAAATVPSRLSDDAPASGAEVQVGGDVSPRRAVGEEEVADEAREVRGPEAGVATEAAPNMLLPHSVHTSFLRGGNPETPLTLEVERVRDGRSFTHRRITSLQGEAVLASSMVSFQPPEPGPEAFLTAPEVPAPETIPSTLELFAAIDHPVAKFLGRTAAFDLRHVEGNLYLRPATTAEPYQHLWARARGKVPASASQTVHRALLAYLCDQIMLEPALRSLGLSWRTEGMSLATLDHAQWFHRDVDVNDWLLFVQDSPSAGSGRASVRARVYNQAGELVSTISQEGMIRVPRDQASSSSGHWGIRMAEGDQGGEILP